MEVNEMVRLFNEEHKSLKQIGEMCDMSKSTVQRRITGAGYVHEGNVYILKDSNQSNNVSHETIEINKQSNNVSRETIENEKMVNGSYTIPVSLAKALKLKAVLEDKKAIDIVREAIENAIEQKYFNM